MGEPASDLCCDGAVAGVLAEGWEGEEDGGGLEIRAEMEEVVDGENDRAGGEMVRCVGAETTWTGGVADGVDEEGSAGPSASLIVASTAAITAEDGDVAEPAAFVVEAASEGEAAAAPRVASRRDSRMRAMAGGGEGDASRAAATFGGGGDATGSGGDEETRDRGVVVVDGVLFPEMPGLAGPAFFWAWNFLSLSLALAAFAARSSTAGSCMTSRTRGTADVSFELRGSAFVAPCLEARSSQIGRAHV